MQYRDETLEKSIQMLQKEVKRKRDSSPNNSIEKIYYRNISKSLDKMWKRINKYEDINNNE